MTDIDSNDEDGDRNDGGELPESSSSAKDTSVSEEGSNGKKESSSINKSASEEEEVGSKSMQRLKMTTNQDVKLSDEKEDDIEVQINNLLSKLQQVDPRQRTCLRDELLDLLSTCSDDHIGLVISNLSTMLKSEVDAQDSGYAYRILLMALELYDGHMTIECLHRIVTSFGDNFLNNEDMFSCFNIIVTKYFKEFGAVLRKWTVDILLHHLGSNAVSSFEEMVKCLNSKLKNEDMHQRDARKTVEYLENRFILLLAVLTTFNFEAGSSVETQILSHFEGVYAPEQDAPFAFNFEDEKPFRFFFSVFVGSLCFRRLHSLLGKIFCLLVDSGYLRLVTRNIDSLEISLRTPCLCHGSFTIIRDMAFNCIARNSKAIIDLVFETLFQQVKSHVLAAELVQKIITNNLACLEGRIYRLGWMNDLAEWIPETLQSELKAEMKLVLKALVDVETKDPRHDPFLVAKMNQLLSE